MGSVKEIHHAGFALDSDPTEDTGGRHRAAGSQLVTARAVHETDILYPSKLPVPEILRHYDHDYVILEGVSDCNVPRILTAHSIEEVQERADGRNIAVSGGILADTGLKDWQGLPVFNALREPEALADFVEERAFAPPSLLCARLLLALRVQLQAADGADRSARSQARRLPAVAGCHRAVDQ